MVPATDAMLASAQFAFVMPFGMFGLTRRMYGPSGAAANVEKKVAKKPSHDAWNARMCGWLKFVT